MNLRQLGVFFLTYPLLYNAFLNWIKMSEPICIIDSTYFYMNRALMRSGNSWRQEAAFEKHLNRDSEQKWSGSGENRNEIRFSGKQTSHVCFLIHANPNCFHHFPGLPLDHKSRIKKKVKSIFNAAYVGCSWRKSAGGTMSTKHLEVFQGNSLHFPSAHFNKTHSAMLSYWLSLSKKL